MIAPQRIFAALPHGTDRYPNSDDPALASLAAVALDAARVAGASYADVRFTLNRIEALHKGGDSNNDQQGIVGIRALANGGWGFAAGPLWSTDAVARLGREAAQQAKHAARGRRRPIELGERPPVVRGHWSMPVEIDPFTVSLIEKLSVMEAWEELVTKRIEVAGVDGYSLRWSLKFVRREQTLATSDGSFVTQTRYQSIPTISLGNPNGKRLHSRTFDALHPCGRGWEMFTNPELSTSLIRGVEEIAENLTRANERIQPNRYDVVLDGAAMGQLMGRTIGIAAEVDRVLGYEANAGGTSYLGPLEEQLGHYAVGKPLFNVLANRSAPGGLATTQWDDEGIAPQTYAVVRDGVFVEGHSSRASAMEIAPLTRKFDRPVQSRGCMASESALFPPLIQSPNLVMQPASDSTSLDDLVAGLERGLLIVGGVPGEDPYESDAGRALLDRQQVSGTFSGNLAYEIKNGKRVKLLFAEQLLIKAPEFWKSLVALGGKSTEITSAVFHQKGEPSQQQAFSVTAPAGRVNNVAVVDVARRL